MRCKLYIFLYYYQRCTRFGRVFSSGAYKTVCAALGIVMLSCCLPLLLVANGHHTCIKCTTADVWLRTPDDGQKGAARNM